MRSEGPGPSGRTLRHRGMHACRHDAEVRVRVRVKVRARVRFRVRAIRSNSAARGHACMVLVYCVRQGGMLPSRGSCVCTCTCMHVCACVHVHACMCGALYKFVCPPPYAPLPMALSLCPPPCGARSLSSCMCGALSLWLSPSGARSLSSCGSNSPPAVYRLSIGSRPLQVKDMSARCARSRTPHPASAGEPSPGGSFAGVSHAVESVADHCGKMSLIRSGFVCSRCHRARESMREVRA